MSFIEDTYRDVGDFFQDTYDDLSGRSASSAAEDAAALQSEAGQEAIDVANAAQLRLEAGLAPYNQFGEGLLGRANTLFGSDAYTATQNDPALMALQDQSMQAILANQAARGRTNTGGTAGILQNNYLANSQNYVNNERNSLMQALGLGQSSAAQTGFAGTNNASNIGSLLAQIANTQGAAGIAGQQAKAAGTQNLIEMGGMLFSDRRLKRNIKKIGHQKGLNVYSFEYIWGESAVGYMADEVEKLYPHAVKKGVFDQVDYGVI